MGLYIAILFLGAALLAAVIVLRRAGWRAAYASGRRAGIKDAQWVVHVQGIASAHVAPEGNLQLGLVRAQVCHQLEVSIGDLLEEQS